jgi:hypothetical protein
LAAPAKKTKGLYFAGFHRAPRPLRMPFEAWPIPRKRIPRIVAVMGRCPHRLLTGSESFSMMQHEFAEDDLLREHPPLWSKRPLGCPHEPDHARNPQARNLEM